MGMLGDGAGGVLGQWDTSKVAPMRRSREDPALWEWVLAVPVGATLQFKLVTVDPGDAVVRWSQGSAIRVDVPRGCAGVDVDVDWPVPRGPRVRSSETGSPDAAGAPLSVRLTAVVEKPLHEYRVETGGAWLAYGAVTRNDDTEDTTESSETDEPSRRLDDTKEDVSSVANERSDSDNRGALRRRPRAFPEPSSLRTSAAPPPAPPSIPPPGGGDAPAPGTPRDRHERDKARAPSERFDFDLTLGADTRGTGHNPSVPSDTTAQRVSHPYGHAPSSSL